MSNYKLLQTKCHCKVSILYKTPKIILLSYNSDFHTGHIFCHIDMAEVFASSEYYDWNNKLPTLIGSSIVKSKIINNPGQSKVSYCSFTRGWK